MKNSPIAKELIINSQYYLPIYKNENEWKYININSWFDCIYYTYKKELYDINNTRICSSSKTKICSIDIGCKNFLSIYGLDGTCYKLKSNYKIIDDILKNDTIQNDVKNIMIKQLINELHIKSATFICKNFNIIYIGYVNNEGNIDSNKMNSIEDNLLKILCHNDFLRVLKKRCKKLKKTLRIVDESFTSVQCTNCAMFHKYERIFSNDDSERRKLHCKYCDVQLCRDLNASKNILIKNEHKFC